MLIKWQQYKCCLECPHLAQEGSSEFMAPGFSWAQAPFVPVILGNNEKMQDICLCLSASEVNEN